MQRAKSHARPGNLLDPRTQNLVTLPVYVHRLYFRGVRESIWQFRRSRVVRDSGNTLRVFSLRGKPRVPLTLAGAITLVGLSFPLYFGIVRPSWAAASRANPNRRTSVPQSCFVDETTLTADQPRGFFMHRLDGTFLLRRRARHRCNHAHSVAKTT